MTNDSLPTIQSKAFFIAPVTPCAYSGLAITHASAAMIFYLNCATTAGLGYSTSGLNKGKSPIDGDISISMPLGAMRAKTRSMAVLSEAARKLPEMAKIFNAALLLIIT